MKKKNKELIEELRMKSLSKTLKISQLKSSIQFNSRFFNKTIIERDTFRDEVNLLKEQLKAFKYENELMKKMIIKHRKEIESLNIEIERVFNNKEQNPKTEPELSYFEKSPRKDKPNPDFNNTAIYVHNNEDLCNKAFTFYRQQGYQCVGKTLQENPMYLAVVNGRFTSLSKEEFDWRKIMVINPFVEPNIKYNPQPTESDKSFQTINNELMRKVVSAYPLLEPKPITITFHVKNDEADKSSEVLGKEYLIIKGKAYNPKDNVWMGLGTVPTMYEDKGKVITNKQFNDFNLTDFGYTFLPLSSQTTDDKETHKPNQKGRAKMVDQNYYVEAFSKISTGFYTINLTENKDKSYIFKSEEEFKEIINSHPKGQYVFIPLESDPNPTKKGIASKTYSSNRKEYAVARIGERFDYTNNPQNAKVFDSFEQFKEEWGDNAKGFDFEYLEFLSIGKIDNKQQKG